MKLEEIEKLCEEATPGPWVSCQTFPYKDKVGYDPYPNLRIVKGYTLDSHSGFLFRKDAEFIAGSRELMPKLLAVAKAAKEVVWADPILTGPEHAKLEKALEELEHKNDSKSTTVYFQKLLELAKAAKMVCIIAEKEKWEAIEGLQTLFKEVEIE